MIYQPQVALHPGVYATPLLGNLFGGMKGQALSQAGTAPAMLALQAGIDTCTYWDLSRPAKCKWVSDTALQDQLWTVLEAYPRL